MMGFGFGNMMGWGWGDSWLSAGFAWFFYLVFWAGIVIFTVWFVKQTKVKEKNLLLLALILAIVSIFVLSSGMFLFPSRSGSICSFGANGSINNQTTNNNASNSNFWQNMPMMSGFFNR